MLPGEFILYIYIVIADFNLVMTKTSVRFYKTKIKRNNKLTIAIKEQTVICIIFNKFKMRIEILSQLNKKENIPRIVGFNFELEKYSIQ